MKVTPKTKASDSIKKLTLAALFAALSCAATMVIQIPSPMTGYVNLGDAVVLLAAFYLGFPYGAAAAAIGSALADLFTGYLHYVPGTFVIKGCMAVAAFLIWRVLRSKGMSSVVSALAAGIAAEGIMVFGYFLYAALLLGNGWSAAASIPGNVVQGIFGCAIAVFLRSAIEKTREGKSRG